MTWPAFRQWWRHGANTRPTPDQARARLEEHMPELVPAWKRLTAMVEGPGADSDAGPAFAATGLMPRAVHSRAIDATDSPWSRTRMTASPIASASTGLISSRTMCRFLWFGSSGLA